MSCLPKQTAFWITFIAYATIHALRMCYSFNKVNIRRQFNISQFYLGFLDAVLYISYAFGVLIRYQIFQGNSNMKKVYFITSIVVSFCFGLVAYVALYTELNIIGPKPAKILLTLSIFLFGFFHLAFYQICGSIISGYYDSKLQSAKLGFWGASASVGNIIGFSISNLVIHQFYLIWQVTFFLMGIFSLLMGFVVYFWLEVPEENEEYKEEIYKLVGSDKEQNRLQTANLKQKKSKTHNSQIRLHHWVEFIKKVISTSLQARYTYAAYITIKTTVYTFLMWFPIFLVSKNLQNVSGYISTLFDVGSTIGGYLIGKLQGVSYDVLNGEQKGQRTRGLYRLLLKYRNSIVILVVIFIILAFIIVQVSLVIYCPLTLLIGFFLGGSYSNVSSHQIFKIANSHMLHTDMLLNLSVGVSCFMVGVIQLMTAFLLKWDYSNNAPEEKTNYGRFFVVLLVLMVVCVGIMWKRAGVLVAVGQGQEEKKTEKKDIQL